MNLQENIQRIKEVMGIITEDNTEKLPVKIYPNGEGSDNAAEYEGEIITIPIADTIPNEPFKDKSYMEDSDSVKDMVRSIKGGEEFPPIKIIEHPHDSSKYIVVDGNHRRYAFNKLNKKEINAVIIPHEDVLLMINKWGSEDNSGIKLSDVEDKDVIDLYFVKPDGSNSFKNKTEELEEKKESGEKWIKCINCRKKFTQTIHKGKKSLPICPTCGTYNKQENTSNETIKEYFSPLNDLNNMLRYAFKLDKEKHRGADSYKRYIKIRAFQKYVDLIYKYATKETQIDGVKGVNVATVHVYPWGEDFSRPNLPPSRFDFEVTLEPELDKNNPPQSQEKFNEQYVNFQDSFQDVARMMGMNVISPIESKDVKNSKVTFKFLNYILK